MVTNGTQAITNYYTNLNLTLSNFTTISTNLVFRYVDKLGNTSLPYTTTLISNYDNDTTPPDIATNTLPAYNEWVAGTVTIFGYGLDSDGTITNNASAIQIYTNGGFFAAANITNGAAASNVGFTNALNTLNLPDGTNRLSYYITNVGITPEGALYSNILLVDNEAPVITTIAVNTVTNGMLYGILTNVTDPKVGLSNILVMVSNGSAVETNYYTNLNITLSEFNTKTTNITFRYSDKLGNISLPYSLFVTNNDDDTTPPEIATNTFPVP
jgi:hypothetical protein